MKKFFYILFFVISIFTFASDENGLGIVEDSDLRAAGVKVENIKKAKELMNQVSSNNSVKMLILAHNRQEGLVDQLMKHI